MLVVELAHNFAWREDWSGGNTSSLLSSFNGGPVLLARIPEAIHWRRNIDAEIPMLPCMVCLIVAYIYTDMTLLFLHFLSPPPSPLPSLSAMPTQLHHKPGLSW